MAGKKDSTEKFLVPAHFKVNRSKDIPAKKNELSAAKLLPPAEYKAPKPKEEMETRASKTPQIDKLLEENKQLREQLQRASEEEMCLLEEIRKNRILVQRGRVDDALDLRRMAETQEENLALQAEIKKLRALTSKMKTEAKQAKFILEAEIEKSEVELERANAVIKELKADLKQKEEMFEKEVEGFEKRSKKQVMVIKNMKAEVQKVEEQIQVDRKGFEDVLSKNEYEKYEVVKTLERRLHVCEEKYLKDVQDMKDEMERNQSLYLEIKNNLIEKEEEIKSLKSGFELREKKLVTEVREYQEKLQASEEDFKKIASQLRSTLDEKTIFYQREVEELAGKLSEKEEELKVQCSLVKQLRAYIGENLPNTQIEKLQAENKEAKETLANLIQENENLRSTVGLLNVRLSSINEILLIQEAELIKTAKKVKRDILNDQSDDLLTKWREKVFALLVQLKSQEILQEKEERSQKAEIKKLVTELNKSQTEKNMLSHALADKNAELQIKVNRCMSLEKELVKCQADGKRLESIVSQFLKSSLNLQDIAKKTELFVEQISSQMDDAFKKLVAFSQRISFASGRVKFLQGLRNHHEAQLRSKLGEEINSEIKETLIDSEETGVSHSQLTVEVDRLTKERDHLLLQFKKDSEAQDRKEAVIKAQCESQLQESAVKISQLESSLKDERERTAAFRQKLETAEAELTERMETVENLKTELAKHRDNAEKTLDRVVQAEQARFTEEFAKLERQFNDVRREHAKAVVALRQAERQVIRQKEKAAEQLSFQQREYESKLDKSYLQIKNLEKERNMLMATVRQEGLKITRSRPKELSSSSEEPAEETDKENRAQTPLEEKRTLIESSRRKQKIHTNEQRIPNLLSKREARQTLQAEQANDRNEELLQMTSVLKDLHSLSTALLTMDKESEDSQPSL